MDQPLNRSNKDPVALVASAKRALRIEHNGVKMLMEAMDGTLGKPSSRRSNSFALPAAG